MKRIFMQFYHFTALKFNIFFIKCAKYDKKYWTKCTIWGKMHICNQAAHLKVVQKVLGIFYELGGFFMRIYHAKDYADMSRKAANIVSAQVIMKPNCVLGLATGSTPIGLYKQLVEWFKKGDLDFSEVMTVNLDEYKGLSRENDQSYYYFMHQNLFDHVNIPVENTHLPNGMEPDSQKECKRYTELIQSLGGVDLQLLGIGHNGHIGFNEPGESFDKQVHCVNLTESTIEANKRFFASADDVPKQAYTMGIKTIMQAKKILIVASGEDKAEIVHKAFFGPITPQVPASVLQLHNDVTLVADEAALSCL